MFKIIFITLCLCLSANAKDKFGVGQRDYVFSDKLRGRNITTHVWYPIDPSVKIEIKNQRGAFVPVIAAMNAEPVAKIFPVVLLSHGAGGTADKLFWLTENLVKKGAVVIGVDHPGNMTRDNSAEGIMKPWLRAKDLSFALDELTKNDIFKSRLNLNRVYAAGHSAGGTTVLLLAGAKFSSARYTTPIPNCGFSKDPYLLKFCEQISVMDLKSVTKEVVEGDYSDSRVKSVVALDPGFARSFDPESFKKLKTKILVIGAAKQPAPEDQIYSGEFKNLLSKNSFEILPNSIHMTFLQPCKPGAEREDAELAELCKENEHKAKMQKSVSERVQSFLSL